MYYDKEGSSYKKILIFSNNITMYNVGLLSLLIGTIFIFGSDRQYRKGKISDMKQLLIVKIIGLLLSAVGVVIMIISK